MNKIDAIQNDIQTISQKIENINNREDIKNSLQQLHDKVNSIQNDCLLISQKTDHINDRTQLHFTLEHDRFNGIIHKLTKECGGNVHEKGIVNVTSSSHSIHYFDRIAPYVVDFEDNIHYFCSENIAGSWLQYDFIDKKVRPTHYSIRSTNEFGKGQFNLKSWVIEGSNNENDWIELDYRKNVTDLDDYNAVQTFEIQKPSKPNESFRYLRIRSTGINSYGYNHILFSALEYFGSII